LVFLRYTTNGTTDLSGCEEALLDTKSQKPNKKSPFGACFGLYNSLVDCFLASRTGFEPVLPPWKGALLMIFAK